ncbi:MAG: class I SAM-dependent methyltransferase [Acidiferrobacterales bacterium]|nr:class I SAM-dependent methyltransferase [Acidiferrobacterales bacterium]
MSTTDSTRVFVRHCADEEERCHQIANTYKLPLSYEVDESEFDYMLAIEDDVLKLRDLRNRKSRPIQMSVKPLTRISRKCLLGRAVGRKIKTVLDGTAGLGSDTLLLARMGYRVTAIERSPVFAALVCDGVDRINAVSPDMSIRSYFADTREVLQQFHERFDAVYLDPMYPEGRKSSVKVARPLTVMRKFCKDDDSDAEELLGATISWARHRVIVKRPNYSQPLMPERLSMSMRGKLVRYDIYLTAGR